MLCTAPGFEACVCLGRMLPAPWHRNVLNSSSSASGCADTGKQLSEQPVPCREWMGCQGIYFTQITCRQLLPELESLLWWGSPYFPSMSPVFFGSFSAPCRAMWISPKVKLAASSTQSWELHIKYEWGFPFVFPQHSCVNCWGSFCYCHSDSALLQRCLLYVKRCICLSQLGLWAWA